MTATDRDAITALQAASGHANRRAIGDLLPIERVIETTGLGRTTIYEEIKAGRFPPPVKLKNNGRPNDRVGWIEAEIDAWKRWKIVQSRGKADLWQPPGH